MKIDQLHLNGLLSFSPTANPIALGPLNVVIGANASGKSNLIDAIALLGALPTDLPAVLREGGGIAEWIWKGARPSPGPFTLRVEIGRADAPSLRHVLQLEPDGARVHVVAERVDDDVVAQHPSWPFHYRHDVQGRALPGPREATPPKTPPVFMRIEDQSILRDRMDASAHAELASLRSFYEGIRIYRDWNTARRGPFRSPVPADLPDDALLADGSNLPMILSALQRHPATWDALLAAMRKFLGDFEDLKTIVQGGTVQVFVKQTGLATLTPPTRLSDGTLRYLALLSILLHPNPPTVVCIEEPELGLHPDVIAELARLLEYAATRMQVVVTTHSDHLVNALSHRPDAILVAERDEAGTSIQRLQPDKLASWLAEYSLGDLWMKGVLGGTRW